MPERRGYVPPEQPKAPEQVYVQPEKSPLEQALEETLDPHKRPTELPERRDTVRIEGPENPHTALPKRPEETGETVRPPKGMEELLKEAHADLDSAYDASGDQDGPDAQTEAPRTESRTTIMPPPMENDGEKKPDADAAQ